MRFLMTLLITTFLAACMPTKEEIWDPRDYELSCDELRDAIGRAVDDDIEARRMRALGYGGVVAAPAAVAIAAPAALAAAPVVVAGAATAGVITLLKSTENKQEAERRRAHLERIYFGKGCVSATRPTDAADKSASGNPPEE